MIIVSPHRLSITAAHERIIALRSAGQTVKRTAELVGCSESQVKKIWAKHQGWRKRENPCEAPREVARIVSPPIKRKAAKNLETPAGYDVFLQDIKVRVRTGRIRAALAVNKELILLYWGIGRDILQREKQQGWDVRAIEQLAEDLSYKVPIVTGLSQHDLQDMRRFAEAWPDEAIVQAPLAQITWGHNVALLEKISSPAARLWYARATTEYGWGESALGSNIERRLFERQGKAVTHFERTLPWQASDLAYELLKGSYPFEFLTLQQDAEEEDIEPAPSNDE